MSEELPAPFTGYECVVRPEWIDYNGHLNIAFYLIPFEEAARAFFSWIDLSAKYRARSGCALFAAETHLTFESEVKAGDRLRFETQLLAHRAKVINVMHFMYHAEENYLAAANEVVYIHVDSGSKRSRPIPDGQLQFLDALAKAHDVLPRPAQAGRAIQVITR